MASGMEEVSLYSEKLFRSMARPSSGFVFVAFLKQLQLFCRNRELLPRLSFAKKRNRKGGGVFCKESEARECAKSAFLFLLLYLCNRGEI